jgi:hypothetical protein
VTQATPAAFASQHHTNVPPLLYTHIFYAEVNFALLFKVPRMGEKRNVYRLLVGKPEGMKNAVLWDVTPCGARKNRSFGGQ